MGRLLQGLTLVIGKQNSAGGQGCLEEGRCQIVLKNQTPTFFYLPPRQRPDRGEDRPQTLKKSWTQAELYAGFNVPKN